jgi:hypothetical protein
MSDIDLAVPARGRGSCLSRANETRYLIPPDINVQRYRRSSCAAKLAKSGSCFRFGGKPLRLCVGELPVDAGEFFVRRVVLALETCGNFKGGIGEFFLSLLRLGLRLLDDVLQLTLRNRPAAEAGCGAGAMPTRC